MSTSSNHSDPVRKHRRAVRYRIVLPVLLTMGSVVALTIALIAGVIAGSIVGQQITIIMGVVFTVFVALPLVLLCIAPVGLLLAAVFGMSKVYEFTARPLRAVRGFTHQVAFKTDELAPKVAAPFVALNLRFTRWEHAVRRLQRPVDAAPNEADEA